MMEVRQTALWGWNECFPVDRVDFCSTALQVLSKMLTRGSLLGCAPKRRKKKKKEKENRKGFSSLLQLLLREPALLPCAVIG